MIRGAFCYCTLPIIPSKARRTALFLPFCTGQQPQNYSVCGWVRGDSQRCPVACGLPSVWRDQGCEHSHGPCHWEAQRLWLCRGALGRLGGSTDDQGHETQVHAVSPTAKSVGSPFFDSRLQRAAHTSPTGHVSAMVYTVQSARRTVQVQSGFLSLVVLQKLVCAPPYCCSCMGWSKLGSRSNSCLQLRQPEWHTQHLPCPQPPHRRCVFTQNKAVCSFSS